MFNKIITRNRLRTLSFSLLLICLLFPGYAAAQWSIGASYQVRNESPKKGFGVQIQRHILQKLPVADIGFRVHFSYFSKNNSISKSGITIGHMTYYDFGIDAIGGVKLGILEPYVGIGIGSNKYKFKQFQDGKGAEFSNSEFYWDTFVGAELTFIPVFHPFIEYRFLPTNDFDFEQIKDNWGFDSNGRLVIGFVLDFLTSPRALNGCPRGQKEGEANHLISKRSSSIVPESV